VLRMQGREVFRHAVEKLSETAETALRKAGLTADDDVDWIVPHQANIGSSPAPPRRWAWAWTASW
jgi:3-oxoacyl-[acyl-carrier-protein] synthase-3